MQRAVAVINDHEYDIEIAPDTNNPRVRTAQARMDALCCTRSAGQNPQATPLQGRSHAGPLVVVTACTASVVTPCSVRARGACGPSLPQHRVWFYFSVSNIPFKNFRILLHVTNFSKSKSLYRDGMSPVVRSRLRPAWYVTVMWQVVWFAAA